MHLLWRARPRHVHARIISERSLTSGALLSSAEARFILQQVACTGVVDDHLYQRLHGKALTPNSNGSGVIDSDAPTDASARTTQCGYFDMMLAVELCCTTGLRDFELLASLAERLVAHTETATVDGLLRLGTAYASLGALNGPLFSAIGAALLREWPSAGGRPLHEFPSVHKLVQAVKSFSSQRIKHEELFHRFAGILRLHDVSTFAPHHALTLMQGFAELRLDKDLGDLWDTLEKHVISSEGSSDPQVLSMLCYLSVLSKRADDNLESLCDLLEKLATTVMRDGGSPVSESTKERGLRWRILLLRASMRYLYRPSYEALSPSILHVFRSVHRSEHPQKETRPAVRFVRKMSAALTKMKIGHICNAERGPFNLDIVERDRKLVYECNHFDRYYFNTTEKIASKCLQERIVKAMGFRVVQVPHWQWNKIRHKRQRMEYLRMSRYYAIKDRRDFSPRDEEVGDPATNNLDFLGEYYFRKERPSASWSWFQPRYDATKRLPASLPS